MFNSFHTMVVSWTICQLHPSCNLDGDALVLTLPLLPEINPCSCISL